MSEQKGRNTGAAVTVDYRRYKDDIMRLYEAACPGWEGVFSYGSIDALVANVVRFREGLERGRDDEKAALLDAEVEVDKLKDELAALRRHRDLLNEKLDETHLNRCYFCEQTVTEKTTERQAAVIEAAVAPVRQRAGQAERERDHWYAAYNKALEPVVREKMLQPPAPILVDDSSGAVRLALARAEQAEAREALLREALREAMRILGIGGTSLAEVARLNVEAWNALDAALASTPAPDRQAALTGVLNGVAWRLRAVEMTLSIPKRITLADLRQRATSAWEEIHGIIADLAIQPELNPKAPAPGPHPEFVRGVEAASAKAIDVAIEAGEDPRAADSLGDRIRGELLDGPKHWPDCALNHGDSACDMGPDCGGALLDAPKPSGETYHCHGCDTWRPIDQLVRCPRCARECCSECVRDHRGTATGGVARRCVEASDA